MLLKLINKVDLNGIVLAHPISVERSVHATELVWLTLAIVLLQMVVDGRGHVSVLRTSTD